VPKFNEQKKTLDEKAPSAHEVWSAIRYLEADIEQKPSTLNVIIPLTAILLFICVMVWLHRAGVL